MGAGLDRTYHVVGGKDLRDLLFTTLADGVGRTSHELFVALRAQGFQPPGADYKGRIKNLHSMASKDERITKVQAGIFAVLGGEEVTEPRQS
ncbi:hypothetical protein Q9R32_02825 [Actinotalea sp. AC32]|nr:hypothetical protein [Actinotalea sp. AC32]